MCKSHGSDSDHTAGACTAANQVQLILMIDDDDEIVTGVRLRLEAAGYQVISAGDGRQGVAAAISRHPDAILLDLQMPRMNGLAALAQLKERADTRGIPVVILSASSSIQTSALDAGARFYLRKPYQAAALLAALDAALAGGELPSPHPTAPVEQLS